MLLLLFLFHFQLVRQLVSLKTKIRRKWENAHTKFFWMSVWDPNSQYRGRVKLKLITQQHTRPGYCRYCVIFSFQFNLIFVFKRRRPTVQEAREQRNYRISIEYTRRSFLMKCDVTSERTRHGVIATQKALEKFVELICFHF